MNKEYIYKKSSSLSVNVAASKVESLRKVVETTSTVRVYDNGLIGVAGQIGDCDMKKLEAEAIKNLENKIPYPCVPSPVIVRSENTIKNIVDTDNFIDVSKRLLARLEKENARLFVQQQDSILRGRSKLYQRQRQQSFVQR